MIFESRMKTTRMLLRKIHFNKIILLIFAALYLNSCEKAGKLIDEPKVSMETEYYEIEFIVEERDRIGWQIFSEDTFSNDINSMLSQAGLTEDKIDEVILKEAEISFLDSENYKNFNILDIIELTVYTDDLGELTIARMNPVPAEQSILLLDLPEENIYPFFRAGSFIVTAQGYLNERIRSDLTLVAKIKFRIKSNL